MEVLVILRPLLISVAKFTSQILFTLEYDNGLVGEIIR